MKTTERPQYITQINAFHRFAETHFLPPNAQLLWFKLMDLCNMCGWQQWVQADTKRLMRWLDAKDARVAYRARDALVNAGLLAYQRGHKGCPNRYRLLFFSEDRFGENGTQSGTQNVPNPVPKPAHINRQDTDENRKDHTRVPAELSEVFGAYAQMRRKMRKPLTDAATQLVLRALEQLAPDSLEEQKKILEQSIVNGWTGVYPRKKEEAPQPPASYDVEEMERRLLYGKIEYKKRSG